MTAPGWEGILDEDEDILWQGRPHGAIDFSGFWSPQTMFGLFFGGFAVFWMLMAFAITSGFNDGFGSWIAVIFPLFGLPFVAVGVFMVFGRFFWDAYQRRRSHYTLTNKAAFIARDIGGSRSLDRYEIAPDTQITLEDGDFGTIWFARMQHLRPARVAGHHRHRIRRVGGTTVTEQRIGFRRIAEARKVYGLMRKVQATGAAPDE